jgi:DNA-binding transcriptional regulator LsrR (DeoR family)
MNAGGQAGGKVEASGGSICAEVMKSEQAPGHPALPPSRFFLVRNTPAGGSDIRAHTDAEACGMRAFAYHPGKSQGTRMARSRITTSRLDDAARAGWLYYIAGRTQDEIAATMGISRQVAQRLVSLAVSERLVRVWMDHPIARCLELAAALSERFGLRQAEVVPSTPEADGGTVGLGEAGAAEMVRWLRREQPIVMAVGTGRTLKAAIDHLPPVDCPQHCVVSLTGNVGPDGTAAYYNVIFSMADLIPARHFPMPLPVFVASPEERALMHGQALIRSTLALAAAADVAFVGIGEMDDEAPLFLDRFLSAAELRAEQAAGAAGEICGWIFDRDGRLLAEGANTRTASAPIPGRERATVIALAKGPRKLPGIAAALRGRLINGLVTDEATAEAILAGS